MSDEVERMRYKLQMDRDIFTCPCGHVSIGSVQSLGFGGMEAWRCFGCGGISIPSRWYVMACDDPRVRFQEAVFNGKKERVRIFELVDGKLRDKVEAIKP